ncbi:MAG: DUF501 domain-containing protein [Actinomycetales bacterium]|nr:DUF501 domain-containing protein [Actinomycetales bacterium]
MINDQDREAIEIQLGRRIRGALAIAHRCSCGQPDVVLTAPRLEDGTPFPTMYYLTCPRLTGAVGTLEADGFMKELEARLTTEPELAANYAAAHQSYLAKRNELADVPEIAGISAGGMPTRVKCLHVLVAHSLAEGPGVNLLGDLVLEKLGDWQASAKCNQEQVCE